MTESALQRAVLDLLALQPDCLFARTNAGGVMIPGKGGKLYRFAGAPEGWADVCGIGPGGIYVALEVKTPHGKTERNRARRQLAFREKVRALGGVAEVVKSQADVVAVLERMRRG